MLLEDKVWYYLDIAVEGYLRYKRVSSSSDWLLELARNDAAFKEFTDNFDEVYRYVEERSPRTYVKKILRSLEFLRENIGVFRETYRNPPYWLRNLAIAYLIYRVYNVNTRWLVVALQHMDSIIRTLPIKLSHVSKGNKLYSFIYLPTEDELTTLWSCSIRHSQLTPEAFIDYVLYDRNMAIVERLIKDNVKIDMDKLSVRLFDVELYFSPSGFIDALRWLDKHDIATNLINKILKEEIGRELSRRGGKILDIKNPLSYEASIEAMFENAGAQWKANILLDRRPLGDEEGWRAKIVHDTEIGSLIMEEKSIRVADITEIGRPVGEFIDKFLQTRERFYSSVPNTLKLFEKHGYEMLGGGRGDYYGWMYVASFRKRVGRKTTIGMEFRWSIESGVEKIKISTNIVSDKMHKKIETEDTVRSIVSSILKQLTDLKVSYSVYEGKQSVDVTLNVDETTGKIDLNRFLEMVDATASEIDSAITNTASEIMSKWKELKITPEVAFVVFELSRHDLFRDPESLTGRPLVAILSSLRALAKKLDSNPENIDKFYIVDLIRIMWQKGYIRFDRDGDLIIGSSKLSEIIDKLAIKRELAERAWETVVRDVITIVGLESIKNICKEYGMVPDKFFNTFLDAIYIQPEKLVEAVEGKPIWSYLSTHQKNKVLGRLSHADLLALYNNHRDVFKDSLQYIENTILESKDPNLKTELVSVMGASVIGLQDWEKAIDFGDISAFYLNGYLVQVYDADALVPESKKVFAVYRDKEKMGVLVSANTAPEAVEIASKIYDAVYKEYQVLKIYEDALEKEGYILIESRSGGDYFIPYIVDRKRDVIWIRPGIHTSLLKRKEEEAEVVEA